jgi:hypothetical protein
VIVMGISFAVGGWIILGGVAWVVWRDMRVQRQSHEAQVGRLLEQITKTNPATSTLKAVRETAEVITSAVDRVTSTIGTSFGIAMGGGQGGIVEQPLPIYEDTDEPDSVFPAHELDDLFVKPDFPNGSGGYISAPPVGDA